MQHTMNNYVCFACFRTSAIVPTTIQVKNETRSATFSFIMQNECETLAPQTKFQVTCVPLQSLLRTAHAASFGTRGMCDDKKALNLQITNLQPATQYNCNVTSTFSGSIYSDTKSMQIKTEEDVPSKNPIVAFGVYESLSCNETRCATVYWQIDNSFTYEGVKEVEIVLYANNSVQPMLNVSKVSPTEFYTFSGLSDYEHYTVYLRAANSVGFNERINASALSLPPTQDGASMEAPLFYFDNQQSTLRMEWPAAPAVRLGTQQGALDAQEVSLYCIAVACQLKDKKCGEKVQWHEAACDDLWTNRNVTVAAGAVQQLVQDLTNVKLGVTVNVYRQGQPWQSTGIRWAECVHSLDSTIDANTLDFVSRNTRLSKGHATVQIDGSLPPCSETGVSPMADLVVLRFGLASNNMERQERVCKVTRRQPVGGFIFSCNADGLSAGTTYDFSVLLSARAGVNSTPSVTFSATVTTDGVQLAVLLAVVTSAIVVFVGLMLASIRLYCYYVNKRRKLPKPESKPEENPLKPEYYVANSEFLRGLTVVDSD